MTHQSVGPGFATLAIHAGAAPGGGFHPGVGADIAQAATLIGLQNFGDAFARSIDPTTAALEERMAALEGGSVALAVASGHAAQFLALHMLLQPGDELIFGCPGGSLHALDQAYRSFGWQPKRADALRPESFERALSAKTRAIFVESLVGPSATIVDLAALATIAKKARVPLIVDNTLATPYLLRPLDLGADIIVHRATRFLGGNETLTGGIIVDGGSFAFADDPRFPTLSAPRSDYGGMIFAETFGNFAFAVACRVLGLEELGPALSPFNAFLILSGLETLALRLQRHSDNALRVADHLERHKAVNAVHYAGLRNDASHALAKLYCPKGAGAVLACRFSGGAEAAQAFVQRLKLFSMLDEIGDARSRASHPASSTHRHLSETEKAAAGITPDLVRLSIGLEDVCDILADIDQALAA